MWIFTDIYLRNLVTVAVSEWEVEDGAKWKCWCLCRHYRAILNRSCLTLFSTFITRSTSERCSNDTQCYKAESEGKPQPGVVHDCTAAFLVRTKGKIGPVQRQRESWLRGILGGYSLGRSQWCVVVHCSVPLDRLHLVMYYNSFCLYTQGKLDSSYNCTIPDKSSWHTKF